MKENMPGQGYSQGEGSVKGGQVSTQRVWVDRGPKRMNTFDTTYLTKGLARALSREAAKLGYKDDIEFRPFPVNIRDRGAEISADDWEPRKSVQRALRAARPQSVRSGLSLDDPYGAVESERRHYTDALREFFYSRIDRLPERDQWHLNSIGQGTSLRDAAKELGIAFQNVDKGRARAVNHLVKLIGTSNKDVANELVFYLKSEGGVALAGRLPDRVLAESTVWRGHE